MSMIESTKEFISEHPYASGGIALGVVFLIWYATRSSGSSGTTTVVQQPDTSADAASVANTQAAADAQTAQAQIAAGVANTSTAAQLAAAIAGSNSATAIAATNASASVTTSANSTIASEFTSLAQTLQEYAGLMTTNENQSTYSGTTSLSTVDQTALNTVVGAQLAESTNGVGLQNAALAGNSGTGGSSVFGNISDFMNTQTNALLNPNLVTNTANYSLNTSSTNVVNAPALSEKGFITSLNGLTQQLGNGVTFHQ